MSHFYIKSKQNAVKMVTQNLKNLWFSTKNFAGIFFGEINENPQTFLLPKIFRVHKIFVQKFLRDLQSFHFVFKIIISKMRN